MLEFSIIAICCLIQKLNLTPKNTLCFKVDADRVQTLGQKY